MIGPETEGRRFQGIEIFAYGRGRNAVPTSFTVQKPEVHNRPRNDSSQMVHVAGLGMDVGPVTRLSRGLRLVKQRYHLIGDHGERRYVIGPSNPDRRSIMLQGDFRGIESHGCMQMAPMWIHATLVVPTVGESPLGHIEQDR